MARSNMLPLLCIQIINSNRSTSSDSVPLEVRKAAVATFWDLSISANIYTYGYMSISTNNILCTYWDTLVTPSICSICSISFISFICSISFISSIFSISSISSISSTSSISSILLFLQFLWFILFLLFPLSSSVSSISSAFSISWDHVQFYTYYLMYASSRHSA